MVVNAQRKAAASASERLAALPYFHVAEENRERLRAVYVSGCKGDSETKWPEPFLPGRDSANWHGPDTWLAGDTFREIRSEQTILQVFVRLAASFFICIAYRDAVLLRI